MNRHSTRARFAGSGFAVLLLGMTACDPAASPGPVADDVLTPRLLDDRAAMQAYLEAFPFDEYEVHEVADVGRFYLDDNPAPVKTFLRRGQAWEHHVLAEFEKHVVPGSTVLDIGAHIGSLTIPLGRLVGREGHVYAFEPQRKVFRELFHNVRLNDLRTVTPLRYAVSSQNEILEMRPVTKADGQVALGKGGDPVEARSIDSFGFRNVSVMKIDVEGHQVAVLEGARQTIGASHPVIIIEIIRNAERSKALLEEYGYRWRVILPKRGSLFDYVAIWDPENAGEEPATGS